MEKEVDKIFPCLICGDDVTRSVVDDIETVKNSNFVDLRAKVGRTRNTSKLNDDTIFQCFLKLFKLEVFEISNESDCNFGGNDNDPCFKFCGTCKIKLKNLLELQIKLDELEKQITNGIEHLKGKIERSEQNFESEDIYKCYPKYKKVRSRITRKESHTHVDLISNEPVAVITNPQNLGYQPTLTLQVEQEPESPSTSDFNDFGNSGDESENVGLAIEQTETSAKQTERTLRKFVEDPQNKLLIYGDKWNKSFPAFTFQILESSVKENAQVQCTHCDLILPYNKECIRRHVAKTHTNRFACPHCTSRFARGSTLRVHVQSVHEGQRLKKLIECKICGKPINAGKRKEHEWSHKSKEEKQEALKDPTAKAAEIPWNRKCEKKFQCDKCSYQFSSLPNLKRHEERMHKDPSERRELCPDCGRTFLNLRIHQRDKHRDDNGVVDLMKTCMEPGCGKKFLDFGKLTQHKDQVHKKLRPWKCTHCGKGFGKKWNLQQHVKVTHGK